MSKENKAPDKSSAATSSEPAGLNTGVAIIGFILSFLAGAMMMWGYDQKRIRNGEIGADTAMSGGEWSDSDSPIPVSSKDPMWGSRTAPVTIVHFSDFQCPFCSRVDTSMQQIKTTYGPDKVRIIWKNEPLPMHPNAKPAAEAAMGVFALKGNDAFWKFHDTAFHNQKELGDASYEQWAKDAGVDIAKFKAGLSAHTWAKKVEEDHQLAQKLGVNGTPASFINGVSLSGAQPFEKFKAVIDQELKKAEAKIASGTPKDKIYVAMSEENKKNAPAEEENEKEDTKSVFKVPVEKSPVKGNPNALVTIVEFSDFQCPYCKKVEPTLKAVMDKYGDKVRLVWKNEPLPFHPRAEPAAEVAMEARAEKGNDGFWAAHDKLFESQPKLDDTDLENVAQSLGLNMDKVRDAMKTHKYKPLLDNDTDLSEDFQASGTPHFFINGHRLVGAQPEEKFDKVIDDEIKHAQDSAARREAGGALRRARQGRQRSGGRGEERRSAFAERAREGQPPSEGRHPGVFRLPMPILQEGRRLGSGSHEELRRQGEVRLEKLPARLPPRRAARRGSRDGSVQTERHDGFWTMHDKLYAAQGTPEGIKRENLEKLAQEQGLDMAKFKNALDNSTHKAEIDADTAAGKAVGVSGTPAFFINGYSLSGAQPFPKFRKLIEKAMSEAK